MAKGTMNGHYSSNYNDEMVPYGKSASKKKAKLRKKMDKVEAKGNKLAKKREERSERRGRKAGDRAVKKTLRKNKKSITSEKRDVVQQIKTSGAVQSAKEEGIKAYKKVKKRSKTKNVLNKISQARSNRLHKKQQRLAKRDAKITKREQKKGRGPQGIQ